jgi:hypothetical protein
MLNSGAVGSLYNKVLDAHLTTPLSELARSQASAGGAFDMCNVERGRTAARPRAV